MGRIGGTETLDVRTLGESDNPEEYLLNCIEKSKNKKGFGKGKATKKVSGIVEQDDDDDEFKDEVTKKLKIQEDLDKEINEAAKVRISTILIHVLDVARILLFNHEWEIRHGASLIIRAASRKASLFYYFTHQDTLLSFKTRLFAVPLKDQILKEKDSGIRNILEDTIIRSLLILALDRFSDFIGDQSNMIVRDISSQSIAESLNFIKSPTITGTMIKFFKELLVRDVKNGWEVPSDDPAQTRLHLPDGQTHQQDPLAHRSLLQRVLRHHRLEVPSAEQNRRTRRDTRDLLWLLPARARKRRESLQQQSSRGALQVVPRSDAEARRHQLRGQPRQQTHRRLLQDAGAAQRERRVQLGAGHQDAHGQVLLPPHAESPQRPLLPALQLAHLPRQAHLARRLQVDRPAAQDVPRRHLHRSRPCPPQRDDRLLLRLRRQLRRRRQHRRARPHLRVLRVLLDQGLPQDRRRQVHGRHGAELEELDGDRGRDRRLDQALLQSRRGRLAVLLQAQAEQATRSHQDPHRETQLAEPDLPAVDHLPPNPNRRQRAETHRPPGLREAARDRSRRRQHASDPVPHAKLPRKARRAGQGPPRPAD